MTLTKIVTTVTPHLLHSIAAAAIIFVLSLFIYFLFKRKFEIKKQRRQFKYRITYIGLIVLSIAMAQIWIEGLNDVFTMVALVATGLIVSNKETIMNLVGFLIINWRGIFTEGDFIQIQNFKGYVVTIRPFYFKIYETTSISKAQATGKTIKIPNNLIITAPTKTFNPETNITLSEISYMVDWSSNNRLALEITTNLINQLTEKYYKTCPHFQNHYLKRKNKELSHLISLKPKVFAKLDHDKDKGLLICINYYVQSRFKEELENEFWCLLQEKVSSEDIQLVFI
ncbi:hypothetical protein CF386_00190 [Paraphotobacterium marinum]|uniref:Small-conductance mechanosensitive channel n=1 Tax=Paraphotobacterium marinum TaxID=1755811 RepID=A0A220VBA8_9GAMM|nr:mechanosensitive ion channel domain-containing protein [Paraphotobacterium marinum]ASK77619.1 hypothetical protein CF386_00190 [Paraphotobacterium marinum]